MTTIVPISFTMGQAGQLIEASKVGRSGDEGLGWVVNPFPRQAQIVRALTNGKELTYPTYREVKSYMVNQLWDNPSSFAGDFDLDS